MKALAKERDRRLGDGQRHLAADVRRHLKNEPVMTGPPSTSYRLRRLVRRNRAPSRPAQRWCSCSRCWPIVDVGAGRAPGARERPHRRAGGE
ncbi:MAG: hypothetical protein IPH86_08395 [bacterium]|nr:hypothetical protein [bacterium]